MEGWAGGRPCGGSVLRFGVTPSVLFTLSPGRLFASKRGCLQEITAAMGKQAPFSAAPRKLGLPMHPKVYTAFSLQQKKRITPRTCIYRVSQKLRCSPPPRDLFALKIISSGAVIFLRSFYFARIAERCAAHTAAVVKSSH